MLSRIDVGIQDRFIRCGTGTGEHHHSKQLSGQWKPFLIFLIHDFHVLFFCGANSIFHWIYTHSDFWWSCKVEKESLMCDSWKGVYCTPSTGYACLKTICWKRQRSPKQAYLLYIISQYLVMSHFNLYLWLKHLKVGGHICKPPMPQIMVIRHRQWTSRKWASFH